MKKKVLLVSTPGNINYFKKEFLNFKDKIEIIDENYSIFKKKISDFTAVVRIPSFFLKKEILKLAKNLEWIHYTGAGIEDILIKELINSKITLTSGKILQGPEIADHALGLCLCLTRQIKKAILKNKIDRPIELKNKTVLIYGVGGVGSLIAERIKTFGCKIIAIDKELKPLNSFIDQIYSPENLKKILLKSDIIFICSPLTKETNLVFKKEEFNAMKKKPYLINVARGKIIHTSSLVNALKSNKLSGVGLDVTDPEPLNKNHYLNNHEKVIITPHNAGLSENNRIRSMNLLKENLKRYFNKIYLLNEINKEKGY